MGINTMDVAHLVCAGSIMFFTKLYRSRSSLILEAQGLPSIVLSVAVLCLIEAARCGSFQRWCGQGGHPTCIGTATACRWMFACEYNIARILILHRSIFSWLQWRRSFIGIRVWYSVTIHLCEVYSLRLQLIHGHCHASLVRPAENGTIFCSAASEMFAS